MGQIIVNGKSYSGNNLNITNGIIVIDGKRVDSEDKVITIEVSGDVHTIDCDVVQVITVKGKVSGDVKTVSGNIKCEGDVVGDAKTVSGSIQAKVIHGNCKTTSGNISK